MEISTLRNLNKLNAKLDNALVLLNQALELDKNSNVKRDEEFNDALEDVYYIIKRVEFIKYKESSMHVHNRSSDYYADELGDLNVLYTRERETATYLYKKYAKYEKCFFPTCIQLAFSCY